MIWWQTAALALLIAASGALGAAQNVRDFGAKGDGSTQDTAAIQAAIDAAAKLGGGEVLVPAGRYMCGTLHLRDHITLHLDNGATLAETTDLAAFTPYEKLAYNPHADPETSYFRFALVAGEDVSDVAIVGEGRVDGNRTHRGGPKTIALKNCRNVTIRGITVENSPNYSISFLGCDWVVVDGVTVRHALADGIDPDCSRYVRISNCFVDSADDAICLKTSLALGERRSTEHVSISNCVLASSNNNFKLGTESSGDFKNISLTGCTMLRRTLQPDNAGIAIESVDGANVDGIVVSNVAMQNVYCPIFIRLGNRGRGLNPPVPGSLQNVSISNIVATGPSNASSITGIPGYPVKHVALDDIRVLSNGGWSAVGKLAVPELVNDYPDSDMFGILPASALFCRHVEDLTIRGLRTDVAKPDVRPALIFSDIHSLDLAAFHTASSKGDEPILWLDHVTDATLAACRLAAPAAVFARITASSDSDVRFVDCTVPKGTKLKTRETPARKQRAPGKEGSK
jgi:hypothetical protein